MFLEQRNFERISVSLPFCPSLSLSGHKTVESFSLYFHQSVCLSIGPVFLYIFPSVRLSIHLYLCIVCCSICCHSVFVHQCVWPDFMSTLQLTLYLSVSLSSLRFHCSSQSIRLSVSPVHLSFCLSIHQFSLTIHQSSPSVHPSVQSDNPSVQSICPSTGPVCPSGSSVWPYISPVVHHLVTRVNPCILPVYLSRHLPFQLNLAW